MRLLSTNKPKLFCSVDNEHILLLGTFSYLVCCKQIPTDSLWLVNGLDLHLQSCVLVKPWVIMGKTEIDAV